MRIELKTLKALSVVTPSGIFLGHIVDIVCDTESQMVVQYAVRRHRIGGDLLLVGREQVIRISEKEMVVDENLSKEEPKEKITVRRNISPEPSALMREKG